MPNKAGLSMKSEQDATLVLTAIADQIVGCNIGNGLKESSTNRPKQKLERMDTYAIIAGSPNSNKLTLVNAIHVHLLENRVRGRRAEH